MRVGVEAVASLAGAQKVKDTAGGQHKNEDSQFSTAYSTGYATTHGAAATCDVPYPESRTEYLAVYTATEQL